MLTEQISLSVTLSDPSGNVNIAQSKVSTDNTEGLVMTDDTYSLVHSGADYIEVTKGDITTLHSVTVIVTSKPDTFAGISVSFGASAGTEAFKITDVFTLKGLLATKVWLKNLDTAGDAVVTVIQAGI